jgi:hypothetical protein
MPSFPSFAREGKKAHASSSSIPAAPWGPSSKPRAVVMVRSAPRCPMPDAFHQRADELRARAASERDPGRQRCHRIGVEPRCYRASAVSARAARAARYHASRSPEPCGRVARLQRSLGHLRPAGQSRHLVMRVTDRLPAPWHKRYKGNGGRSCARFSFSSLWCLPWSRRPQPRS